MSSDYGINFGGWVSTRQSPKVPRQQNNNFVERIIAEQMLPRTEQQEIIRRIRQEDFKAKAQEHMLVHKSKTSVEKHKTNIAILFHNQVETNAATGYSPPQTYAQLKRMKSEVSSQYKRNYISSGTS